ncbi:MAG TPA: MarR family transcriptional regulator [Dehalococcoidia bacterium]|nr:MarR family transcriptional regulator [Dehalococcoidia bacterium]
MGQQDQQTPAEELWWLLMQVGTLVRRVAERRLSSARSSPDQVQALQAIAARQPLTVGEIARAMGLERNSASQLVERLVQQGLVERERSLSDRRQVFVSVSEEGRLALEAAAPSVRALATELLGAIGDGQIREAAATLRAMRESAGALLQGTSVEPGPSPIEISAAG